MKLPDASGAVQLACSSLKRIITEIKNHSYSKRCNLST